MAVSQRGEAGRARWGRGLGSGSYLATDCVATGESAPISELHLSIHQENPFFCLFYKLNFHIQLLLNNFCS